MDKEILKQRNDYLESTLQDAFNRIRLEVICIGGEVLTQSFNRFGGGELLKAKFLLNNGKVRKLYFYPSSVKEFSDGVIKDSDGNLLAESWTELEFIVKKLH